MAPREVDLFSAVKRYLISLFDALPLIISAPAVPTSPFMEQSLVACFTASFNVINIRKQSQHSMTRLSVPSFLCLGQRHLHISLQKGSAFSNTLHFDSRLVMLIHFSRKAEFNGPMFRSEVG